MSALAQAAELAKSAAWARAQAEGWDPIGTRPDESGGFELMAVRDQMLYVYETANREAAISTGADTARAIAPAGGSAAQHTVGVWDQGGVRTTHREFGGRATLRDNSHAVTHATHVAGTIGAAGIDPSARGMAPDVRIDSYDWNNDLAEMTSRAMSRPGEAGMLQVSSHSYGFIAGWANTFSPPRWYGTWGESKANYFGMYDWYASQWDTLCYEAPYYLPFKSAGNNRSDRAPAAGASFQYYDNGWKTKAYDPTTDPLGDGAADGGFDSIPLVGNAKNVMTVGAVHGAVRNGVRDVETADMTGYSGWGPADDGRIKPDIVAKGSLVYSTRAGHDADYANMSGTSMATPNAAGSAALLVAAYANLFPGQSILASSLKGLILHTADDLGNPGPDYQYGWGLMNTRAALEHLQRHAANPETGAMVVETVDSDQIHEYRYAWDGSSPVRVTVCWTDPPGRPVYALDHAAPRLVNDLDLRLIDPDGTVHLPYVLDPARPEQPATFGVNRVDNTEQVRLSPSGEPGIVLVQVVAPPALANHEQTYSLIVSGVSAVGNPQPPSVSLDAPVDVVRDGTGRVRVSGRITDPDSPAVALEVQFAAEENLGWKSAWLASAQAGGHTLAVDNTAAPQILDLPLHPDGTFVFTWDSLGGPAPLLRSSQVRLRVRAWDGDSWSEWRDSEPFLLQNEGPDSSRVTYTVSTWAFERYVVNTSVSIAFTNFMATAHPIAGYLYGLDPDPDRAAFTLDEYISITDLVRGRESVIHLWAVDTMGALSRPVRITVYALPLSGNWDGTSDPTQDMLEGTSGTPPQDALLVEASATAGMPILRFPYLAGKRHWIEAVDALDGAARWKKLENLQYTIDRGWIVWVNNPAIETDAPTFRFFRVCAE